MLCISVFMFFESVQANFLPGHFWSKVGRQADEYITRGVMFLCFLCIYVCLYERGQTLFYFNARHLVIKYISLRLTVTCAETSAATSDVLGNKHNKVRRVSIGEEVRAQSTTQGIYVLLPTPPHDSQRSREAENQNGRWTKRPERTLGKDAKEGQCTI